MERSCQVGRRPARELDDNAVQVFEVVGVAAADRQQRPTVSALVAPVQRQQRGDVGVGAVVRIQELEPVDAKRCRQRPEALPPQPDPERVDVGNHHERAESLRGDRCLAEREEFRRRGARERRLDPKQQQVLERPDGELDAPDRLDPAGWMGRFPLARPLERPGVVVVGDPDDVDLAVSVGVVEDLLNGGRAIAKRRVEVEDRLPHSDACSVRLSGFAEDASTLAIRSQ